MQGTRVTVGNRLHLRQPGGFGDQAPFRVAVEKIAERCRCRRLDANSRGSSRRPCRRRPIRAPNHLRCESASRGSRSAGYCSLRACQRRARIFIRLRFEAGRRPRGARGIAIFGMNGIEPAVAGMRIPGWPGEVFPGGLQLLECAVAARLPGHVGQQLRERARAFFALAQLFVVGLALDQIRGEARQDVEQPQVAFARLVRTPSNASKSCRRASPRREISGRRLHGANAGVPVGSRSAVPARNGAVLDIRHDHAFSRAHCVAATAGGIGAHPGPELRGGRVESAMAPAAAAHRESPRSGWNCCMLAKSESHDRLRAVHELRIHRGGVGLARHLEAHGLQRARRFELRGELGFVRAQPQLGALALQWRIASWRAIVRLTARSSRVNA